MNYFSVSSIFIFIISLLMGLIVLTKGKDRSPSKIFAIFCFIVSIWGIGGYNFSSTQIKERAIFWWKIATICTIYSPIFYAHFVFEFLRLKKRNFLLAVHFLSLVLLYFCFFQEKLFFGNFTLVFNQFYCIDWTRHKSLIFFIFYIVHYWGILGYAFYLLLKRSKQSTTLSLQQIRYFIFGSIIGWFGAHSIFLVVFGFNFYPFTNVLIGLYTVPISYAIVRYRLMDITVALTRTSIFISVYSIVLGIPFLLAFGWQERLISLFGNQWWLAPLITSTVLATAGPFIYLFVDKKAEAKIFEEQLRYQNTLRQASSGMGRIKDLNRLINLIVHIVTRTVRLEHAILYLDDPENKRFIYGAKRSRTVRFKPKQIIERNSSLVEHLMYTRSPVVYEEIRQRTQEFGDRKLARLEAELKELEAAVVVPSFIDERLLAIIVLGEKVSKKVYSDEDLAVFSILSNQAALAIENAMFYDDMKQTHEQLFKAEKMATIGTMADGLSHQINNRLHALGFIAGDALDTIKMKKNLQMSPELKEMMVDLEHALTRIQDNVAQGGDVVRGLLKYTRKGEEGFSVIKLEDLINAAIEMTQFKIKPGAINIIKTFGADVPSFQGNFTQLQEVFFNLIDNAYDAMMERKDTLGEDGYKPTIKISADYNNKYLKILFEDNGIGIKGDDAEKLFTPFYTTKLSSKKGTGLGLYVIQKLIEGNHKGKVKYDSEYGKGTRVDITLPLQRQ